MQALISPNEQVFDSNENYLGTRIAQVEPDDNIFCVAPPMYWMPCDDFVTSSGYYLDPNNVIQSKNPIFEVLDAPPELSIPPELTVNVDKTVS
jgi:hypothetical protein